MKIYEEVSRRPAAIFKLDKYEFKLSPMTLDVISLLQENGFNPMLTEDATKKMSIADIIKQLAATVFFGMTDKDRGEFDNKLSNFLKCLGAKEFAALNNCVQKMNGLTDEQIKKLAVETQAKNG